MSDFINLKVKQFDKPLFRLIIPRIPYPNVFSHLVMPPLGAIYVATAASKAGKWDVEVIDEMNWASGVSKRDLASNPIFDHMALQARRPASAVGFYGGLTSTIPRLYDLAEFYKSQGIPTIAGGSHVDALPVEALNNGIDIVVHGEGENTILEILDSLDGNRELASVNGLSFTASDGSIIRTEVRYSIHDLDSLPIPDFSLLAEKKKTIMIAPFGRNRGCNFNCEFCVVHDMFGPSRSASPEHVIAELEKRIDEGYRYFFCVDDNFTQGSKSTRKLLSLIQDLKNRKRVKLDFTVQVRSSVGRDEELMQAMRAAGVRMLAIGLESPISEELEGMEKEQTPEQIEEDVKSLRMHGFMIHGMFIFGYPVENGNPAATMTLREKADRYIEFIRRTAIDTIQVLKPVPIPGSRLANRLKEQGRILPLNIIGWDKYDGSYLTFLPDSNLSATELQKQATRIMRKFYSPFSFMKFPELVFTTPVEILRLGFKKASEFAHDPKECTRIAIRCGVERISAFKAGFREAGSEVKRRWRQAAFRTFGSAVVTNAMKRGHHVMFLKTLSNIQNSTKAESNDNINVSGT